MVGVLDSGAWRRGGRGIMVRVLVRGGGSSNEVVGGGEKSGNESVRESGG